MNKVIIVIIILIVVLLYSLPSTKVVNINGKNKKDFKENTSIKYQKTTGKNILLTDEVGGISPKKDFNEFSECGFSSILFYKSFDSLDISSYDEKKLEMINHMIASCDVWFSKLEKLSEEDLKKLKTAFDKKMKLVSDLTLYSYDSTINNKARDEVYNADSDVMFSALMYLINYDYNFTNKIANEIGSSDSTFLLKNLNLGILYSCQHAIDCSKQSPFMMDFCTTTPNACGLSFSSWLRSGQITLNQYDDLIRASEAINRTLNSDWFAENPVEYPLNQDGKP